MGFEVDRFVADCREAIKDSAPTRAISHLLARTMEDPQAITRALGMPERAGLNKLYVANDLTILNVIWAPGMTLMPHNHNMWAAIGVYGGREDNIFWRRLADDRRGRIEAAGAKSIGPREVRPLGRDIIHSVTNPTSQFTAAIHIYGGDFFTVERSQWDPEHLEEHPYDLARSAEIFEEANARLNIK